MLLLVRRSAGSKQDVVQCLAFLAFHEPQVQRLLKLIHAKFSMLEYSASFRKLFNYRLCVEQLLAVLTQAN